MVSVTVSSDAAVRPLEQYERDNRTRQRQSGGWSRSTPRHPLGRLTGAANALTEMSAAQSNGSRSSASAATASSSTLDKGKGPASTSTATAADADLFDDAELDRIFNQEASQVAREAEVRLPRPSSVVRRR